MTSLADPPARDGSITDVRAAASPTEKEEAKSVGKKHEAQRKRDGSENEDEKDKEENDCEVGSWAVVQLKRAKFVARSRDCWAAGAL